MGEGDRDTSCWDVVCVGWSLIVSVFGIVWAARALNDWFPIISVEVDAVCDQQTVLLWNLIVLKMDAIGAVLLRFVSFFFCWKKRFQCKTSV